MGVLMKSGSGLQRKCTADRGVAVEADVTSDGKVAERGVESFSSLGLTAGIVTSRAGRGARRWETTTTGEEKGEARLISARP